MRVEFLKVARHFASLVTVIIFTQCSRILSSSSYLEAKSLEFGYFLASKSGSWLMRRLISSLALFFRDCWTLGWLEVSFITSLTEVKGWIPVALMASDITSEMTSPTAPEGLCLDDNRRRLADWVVKYASLNGLWVNHFLSSPWSKENRSDFQFILELYTNTIYRTVSAIYSRNNQKEKKK